MGVVVNKGADGSPVMPVLTTVVSNLWREDKTQAGTPNGALAYLNGLHRDRAFFESIKAMQYSGTIAMMQIVPDQESEAREFAVVAGAGRAWLMIGAEDGKSQIGAIDSASFGKVMDSLLAALSA